MLVTGVKKKKRGRRIKLGTELISVRNVALRTCSEFFPSPGLVWVSVLEGTGRIGGQLRELWVQAVWQAEGGPADNYKEEYKTGESEERQGVSVHGYTWRALSDDQDGKALDP